MNRRALLRTTMVALALAAAGPAVCAEGAALRHGSLTISGAVLKAMVPGAKVGGGGVTIRNDGDAPDRLLSVMSPAAGRVEMHSMTMNGDVMTMRRIEGGIEIPAGGSVTLSGERHLMFMDLAKPFAEGTTVPVTLTFEKAGPVDILFDVGSATGR